MLAGLFAYEHWRRSFGAEPPTHRKEVAMDFAGRRAPLSRTGHRLAVEALGLGAEGATCLWAVIDVETTGTTQGYGFRSDGRPQILYERHKFREFTGGRFDEHPQLSGPRGGYGSLAEQYNKLDAAVALSVDAGLGIEPALKSASWGLGQVMGFNHQAAGFTSAEEMVGAMKGGEDAQLLAMVNFMSQHPAMLKALRQKDWALFAKSYNGSRYFEAQYDVKLDASYQRYSTGSTPDLEVRAAQAALLYLGYAPGKVDGVIGPRTQRAIDAFRLPRGLTQGPGLDGPTLVRLFEEAKVVF
jgi:N-acetylmuramidase/Putative peptidoglycan binding domain